MKATLPEGYTYCNGSGVSLYSGVFSKGYVGSGSGSGNGRGIGSGTAYMTENNENIISKAFIPVEMALKAVHR